MLLFILKIIRIHPLIIGIHGKDDKMIQVNLDLHCSNCGKKVPGGIKASEKYHGTESFKKELEVFQKSYLCGICRDKKRTKKVIG